MIKIKDMKTGDDNVEFIAMIITVNAGKTKGANKSNYLNIVLQDDTGRINAKLWNASSEHMEGLKDGAVITGVGDIITYNKAPQMNISKIENISYQEAMQIQFLGKAPQETDDMVEELYSYINKITNTKIFSIITKIMDTTLDKFKVYPAASKNHHEFVSGLIYHTLSMLRIAESLIKQYPQLNADLVYAGVILHDIGKTEELSGPVVPSYTIEGKLLGHISIAQSMVADVAKQLYIEGEEVILLQHLILSHHGKQEYGSPVIPLIREAEIVHFIDNIDARMNMFDKALENVENGEFSTRVFSLENRAIYKPKMYNQD